MAVTAGDLPVMLMMHISLAAKQMYTFRLTKQSFE